MSFERGAECPPAVEVERHSAGEETKWRGHIEGCANCTAYARELKDGSEAFIKQRTPELFMKQVERRAAQPAPRAAFWRWMPGIVGLLLAVPLSFLVVSLSERGDEVRFKGGSVEVYFKRGLNEPSRLVDGEKLKPGDTLRFRYRGQESAHVAIIERDGAGSVTVFAPFDGSQTAELQPESFFPDAVAVDDTPGRSTLFIIKSARRVELQALVESARAFQDPRCDGCEVDVLHYEKLQ